MRDFKSNTIHEKPKITDIGSVLSLTVLRKTDIGYILIDKEEKEILMHFNDSENQYKEGDLVFAFTYFDNVGRSCATDKEVYITKDEAEFLEVIDYNSKLGFFLDMGINKHLLLSHDDLPNKSYWPQKGDKVFVRLKSVKTGLYAKLVNKEDLNRFVDIEDDLEIGKKYKATVIKSGTEGVNLLTECFNHVFVFKNNLRNIHRLGESVEVKIINEKSGDFNGSLIEQKEIVRLDDAKIILKYLEENGRCMKLDSKSDAKEIYDTFRISKRAFKSAIGALYKNRDIEFENGSTYLLRK